MKRWVAIGMALMGIVACSAAADPTGEATGQSEEAYTVITHLCQRDTNNNLTGVCVTLTHNLNTGACSLSYAQSSLCTGTCVTPEDEGCSIHNFALICGNNPC